MCRIRACVCVVLVFFKQKTAYEMRISDWSSGVCSSDLRRGSSPSRARSGIAVRPSCVSSEYLGADQALGQQDGDRLTGLPDHVAGGVDHMGDLVGVLGAQTDDTHRLQDRLRRLPHRDLPGLALADPAATRQARTNVG